MVSRRQGFLGLATLAAAAIGCSSSVQGTSGTGGTSSSTTTGATTTGAGGSTTSTGTGGAGGGATTTTTTGAGGATTTTTTGAGGSSSGVCAPLTGTFAVRKLFFGDTNPDGTPNAASGWKQYGVNIDGKVSTAASVDLCQPLNNASKNNVYPDGNNGIDNSFGKNVLPIFLGIFPDFSTQSNQGIVGGAFTLLLHLEGLGAAPDQGSIVARAYQGSTLPMNPSFDGSDCWPVTPDSLVNPLNFASAKAVYPQSALAQNQWSSVTPTELSLSLFLQGLLVPLKIHHARIEMTLSPAHDGVAQGVIGGVLDTQELSEAIKQMAGSFDPSLCSGPTINSILAQIGQASDILVDGSQNPNLPCNGISIGLGFQTGGVQLGAIGPEEPAPPNPCGP